MLSLEHIQKTHKLRQKFLFRFICAYKYYYNLGPTEPISIKHIHNLTRYHTHKEKKYCSNRISSS